MKSTSSTFFSSFTSTGSSFFSAIIIFSNAFSSSFRCALLATLTTAAGIVCCSSATAASSSLPWSERAWRSMPSICFASAMLSLARSPVMATTRRMPLEMEPSSTMAKNLACAVLERCVPPQNSTE